MIWTSACFICCVYAVTEDSKFYCIFIPFINFNIFSVFSPRIFSLHWQHILVYIFSSGLTLPCILYGIYVCIDVSIWGQNSVTNSTSQCTLPFPVRPTFSLQFGLQPCPVICLLPYCFHLSCVKSLIYLYPVVSEYLAKPYLSALHFPSLSTLYFLGLIIACVLLFN